MLNRKAQSVAEYAIILAVVIGAAAAMQVYVKRGLQAKVKSGTDAYTSIQATLPAVEAGGATITFSDIGQYEPYYLESDYERYQENVERQHMGGGKIVAEKVSDFTFTKPEGYQLQAGPQNRTERDNLWGTGSGG